MNIRNLMILVALYTGIRIGELCGLKGNDIDFKNNTLSVNKGISDNVNGKRYIISSPKTKSSNRTLPLPKEVVNELKELKQSCMKYTNYNDSWFVFGAELPLGDDAIRRRKIRNCKLAKVKQIRTHDFRHSCASLLINNGADITLVAKFLGHSKIDGTLNTYAHMFQNKLNNIIGIIDNLNDNAKLDNKSNEFDNDYTDYEKEIEDYDNNKDDFEISL